MSTGALQSHIVMQNPLDVSDKRLTMCHTAMKSEVTQTKDLPRNQSPAAEERLMGPTSTR